MGRGIIFSDSSETVAQPGDGTSVSRPAPHEGFNGHDEFVVERILNKCSEKESYT